MSVPRAMAGVAPEGSPGERRGASLPTYAVLLLQFFAILGTAELLFVLASGTGDTSLALVGLLLDAVLVFLLPVEAAFLLPRDRAFAAFLGSLILPPLLRIVTLSVPSVPFTRAQWLSIVSIPLLLAAAAVMRAERLTPRDVFLGPGRRRYIALNIALAASGAGIGFAEFRIFRPEALIPSASSEFLIAGAVGLFLATGLAEELIYRGVLLRTARDFMGRGGAVLFTSLVFALLHVGFQSLPDLGFAFGVGLVFGIAVLFTQSLWGAVGAHTIANIVYFLILPFGML